MAYYKNAKPVDSSAFVNSLTKHAFLLMCTFGIYQLVWIYRTTRSLTVMDARRPGKETALCLFIPFYLIYWHYQTALLVDYWAAENNLYSDLRKVTLFSMFFIPFLAPVLIQEKINFVLRYIEKTTKKEKTSSRPTQSRLRLDTNPKKESEITSIAKNVSKDEPHFHWDDSKKTPKAKTKTDTAPKAEPHFHWDDSKKTPKTKTKTDTTPKAEPHFHWD